MPFQVDRRNLSHSLATLSERAQKFQSTDSTFSNDFYALARTCYGNPLYNRALQTIAESVISKHPSLFPDSHSIVHFTTKRAITLMQIGEDDKAHTLINQVLKTQSTGYKTTPADVDTQYTKFATRNQNPRLYTILEEGAKATQEIVGFSPIRNNLTDKLSIQYALNDAVVATLIDDHNELEMTLKAIENAHHVGKNPAHEAHGKAHALVKQKGGGEHGGDWLFTKAAKDHVDNAILKAARLEALQALLPQSKTQAVAFYHQNFDPKTAFLGNFHICPAGVQYNGMNFKTSESAYQAAKLLYHGVQISDARFNQLQVATNGDEIFRIGQTVPSSSDWKTVNRGIMKEIVRQKYSQNPYLLNNLQALGGAYLYEHSYRDGYWGDNGDGSGSNELGKIHMELRAELLGLTGVIEPPAGMVRRAQCSMRCKESAEAGKTFCWKHVAQVASTNFSICQRAQCKKPVHPGFEYCGRYHGREVAACPTLRKINTVAQNCIQCGLRPKWQTSDYCGQSCARSAGALR